MPRSNARCSRSSAGFTDFQTETLPPDHTLAARMKTAADREAPAGTMARRRQREPCCSEVRPLTCSPAQSSSHLRASRPYISGDPNLKRKASTHGGRIRPTSPARRGISGPARRKSLRRNARHGRARPADLLRAQTYGRTRRLSDHPAQASAGRDDVKILKNIQGRRRKSSICHLAMPVAISMARLVQ
jgi:hypothetical protein